MHITYVLSIDDLPTECISDCSAQGSVDEAVAYWRKELNFTVDRNRTIACLKGYGSWDEDELSEETDETLAERVLWLACGSFSEYQDGGEDAGSDVFCLE